METMNEPILDLPKVAPYQSPIRHTFTPRHLLAELAFVGVPTPSRWANLWHSVILRRYLTLTSADGYGLIMVSWQDGQHRIKKIVWERP